MKSEHANHRKVLASFLEEIPENKGWWGQSQCVKDPFLMKIGST
jgi:hypothetical protein